MATEFPWSVLKKYDLDEKAEKEISKLNLNSPPYDMQANNKIYCRALSHKFAEFRNKMTEKQQEKLCEIHTEGFDSDRIHNCYSIYYKSPASCREKCDFCNNEIRPLVESMEELQEVIDYLKEAAQKDYDLR